MALIYLINALFTAAEIVNGEGISGLGEAPLSRFLLPEGLRESSTQLTSIAWSLAGITVLALILTLTARMRYAYRQRSLQRQLERFRADKNREFERDWKAEIDDETDVPQWVAQAMDNDSAERWTKLQQIKEWFAHDELLVQWTALEISRRRFWRDLLGAVVTAAGVVIVARFLALLG